MIEFDLGDRTNYLRADRLTFGSIEFFAMCAALVFFLFFTKRRLLDLYIILLPFTDLVYRVASLQPSDIVAILIVVRYRRYIFGRARFLYLLVPVLALGSLVGLFVARDTFGLFYSIRLVLTLAVVNVMTTRMLPGHTEEAIRLYKRVVLFSIGVGLVQLLAWLLGFQVSGVFFLSGVPRVKGLAHEPATFATWLALSLVVGFRFAENRKVKCDWPFVIVTLIGVMATASSVGIVLSAVILAPCVFLAVRRSIARASKLVVVGAVIVVVTLPITDRVFSSFVVPKLVSYASEFFGAQVEGVETFSGRGGDLHLFDYLSEQPVFGVGAFRASRLQLDADGALTITRADEFIPATNFYITSLAEFGVVGFAGMMLVFLIWARILLAHLRWSNLFFGVGLVAWLVSLLGIRVFAFHQPWFMLALYLTIGYSASLAHSKPTPASAKNTVDHLQTAPATR